MRFNQVFLFFLVSGCSFVQKPQIHVHIEDESGQPVKGATVVLMDFGEKKSDIIGEASWGVQFKDQESFLVFVTNEDENNLFYPKTRRILSPKWWQNQHVEVNMRLVRVRSPASMEGKEKQREILSSSLHTIEQVNATTPLLALENQKQKEGVETVILNQLPIRVDELPFVESDILPLSNDQLADSLSEANHKVTINEKKIIPVIQKEQKKLESKNLDLFIKSVEVPLSGAKVYLTQAASQTLVEIGSTGPSGHIKLIEDKSTDYENLFVYHPCCQSVIIPVNYLKSYKELFIDLKNGKNMAIQNSYYAYGLARTLENIELLENGAKKDISGRSGFIVSNSKSPATFSLSYTNSLISYLPLSQVLDKKEQDLRFVTVYWDSKENFKPSVVIYDPKSDNIDPYFRRFRREFLSQMSRSSFIKYMNQKDFIDRVQALPVSTSVDDVLKNGWYKFGKLNLVDFVLNLDFSMNREGEKVASITLVDRKAQQKFLVEYPLLHSEPEALGRKAYQSFLSSFPWETSLKNLGDKKDFNELEIGLGKDRGVEPEDIFLVEGAYSYLEPPKSIVGIARVISSQENSSKLKWLFGQYDSNLKLIKVTKLDKNDKRKISFFKEQIIKTKK